MIAIYNIGTKNEVRNTIYFLIIILQKKHKQTNKQTNKRGFEMFLFANIFKVFAIIYFHYAGTLLQNDKKGSVEWK